MRGSNYSIRLQVLVVLSFGVTLLAQSRQETIQFGGVFSDLTERQQFLVRDWFRRFNEVMEENLGPGTEYDKLPLTARTTFEAVTHALERTILTDKETDREIGPAIELIQALESVAGRVRGVGGDRQFRLYVTLKDGVVDTLKRSKEFSRGHDNTVYHKGYPTNYRQKGVPSAQFSISRSERHADIDVDYRSSGFPAGLFNGHLTTSNSDVRAGGNHGKHVRKWEGLQSWWDDHGHPGSGRRSGSSDTEPD